MSLQPLPSTCPRLRHILTGTFNTIFLHLLTYDTVSRTLSVTSSIPAQGPHQYLTVGSIPTANERIVYATTWAEEKRLSSWRVSGLADQQVRIEYVNSKEITATPSYVSVQPPPWRSLTSPVYGVRPDEGKKRFLYQAGGPTGEVFEIEPGTGALGEKVQELVFLEGGRGELANADKSRKALRYGAHSVDFDVNGLGYIAHVGRNAIFVHSRDSATNHLSSEPLLEIPSPTAHDGPRHVVPSPNGQYIFAVTEHTSFVDVYRIQSSPSLEAQHIQRVSIIPTGESPGDYRGDTVRLSPDGKWLFATTRGMHVGVRGWVKGWRVGRDVVGRGEDSDAPLLDTESTITYHTPTSGGKANAFEWAPRYPLDDAENYKTMAGTSDLAVLTDDDQGYVVVLEWDGKDLKEVARTQLPGVVDGQREGASHAIWLS